jgi:hypothetical protein
VANRYLKNKASFYALAALVFLGAALMVFILAADEQSVRSSGSPAPARLGLQDFIAQGPGGNRHVELVDFTFGKQYIYTAELVQVRDVYLPLFPNQQPENAGNLRVLLWIRNDRHSNEPLVLTRQDLDRFVAEFNRRPRSVTGVLRKPTSEAQTLTAEAYPGTNSESLQVLWARDFPEQQSINVLWSIWAVCLVMGAACAVAFRRQRRAQAPAVARQ